MSRAKFEEWYAKVPSARTRVGWTWEQCIAYEAWLAGRQSMRDEAAKRAKEVSEAFLYVEPSFEIYEDAIRKIEL